MPDLATMIAYERGELDEEQTRAFFQQLLNTGLIFDLQGSYQRVATGLLEAGVINLKETNHA